MSLRPVLSRDYVGALKRDRILRATARVVAAKGPHDAKIGDLVGEAGVARKTLYDLLGDKQNCLERALQHSAELIAAKVNEADPVDDALVSLLSLIQEHPEYAALHILHGPTISVGTYETNRVLFADLFRGTSESTAHMLVGGVERILGRHLLKTPEADARLLFNGLRDFIGFRYQPDALLARAAA